MIRPLCLCGCGRRVKKPRCKYASVACIPSSTRAANARKARATFAHRQRAEKYGAAWGRFQRSGQTETDFYAIVQGIAEHFWAMGYTARLHREARAFKAKESA